VNLDSKLRGEIVCELFDLVDVSWVLSISHLISVLNNRLTSGGGPEAL